MNTGTFRRSGGSGKNWHFANFAGVLESDLPRPQDPQAEDRHRLVDRVLARRAPTPRIIEVAKRHRGAQSAEAPPRRDRQWEFYRTGCRTHDVREAAPIDSRR